MSLDPFELLSAAAARAGVDIVHDTETAHPDNSDGQWTLPHPAHEHARSVLAWPHDGPLLGHTEGMADEGRAAWAALANRIAEHEPVSVLCRPADQPRARRLLAGDITLVPCQVDSPWIRDSGVSIAIGVDAGLALLAPATSSGTVERHPVIDALARECAAPVLAVPGLPSQNGQFTHDGAGVAIAAAGGAEAAARVGGAPGVEAAVAGGDGAAGLAGAAARSRLTGITTVHRVGAALPARVEHVRVPARLDTACQFGARGVLFLHDQRADSHPDTTPMRAFRTRLVRLSRADGWQPNWVDLPAPGVLRDRAHWVSYSYVPHVVTNSSVIVGSFRDPADAVAAGLLGDHYNLPVSMVDARGFFARGAGLAAAVLPVPVARVAR